MSLSPIDALRRTDEFLRKMIADEENDPMTRVNLRYLREEIVEPALVSGRRAPPTNCMVMPCICRLKGRSDEGCPYKL